MQILLEIIRIPFVAILAMFLFALPGNFTIFQFYFQFMNKKQLEFSCTINIIILI